MKAFYHHIRCSKEQLSDKVKMDEVYFAAGLKGCNNHERIKFTGCLPRRCGLKWPIEGFTSPIRFLWGLWLKAVPAREELREHSEPSIM